MDGCISLHAEIEFLKLFGSVAQSCLTLCEPWTVARQASLSITNSLLKLMSIELVMTYNHLILCQPLLLPPSIFPSIRVFFNEPILRIRWPKYWSFSFSISPSNEHSGLISFRIDWFDLLVISSSRRILLLLAEGPEAEAGFFFVKEDINTYGRMLETYESK